MIKANRYIVYYSLIALLLNSVILLLLSNKISVVCIFLILNNFIHIKFKEDSNLLILFFNIGIIICIFFYLYWIEFYGNSYYLGRKSDDWQYDFYWTEGFIEKYGINLSKIDEHLNSIEPNLGFLHNSKGYVAFIIILRWLSSFFDGYHTLIPRIVNIFFLLLTAIYSSRISFVYSKSNKIRAITLLSIFFYPVLLFNSVHVFRDSIITFILVYIFYLLINPQKKNAATYIVIVSLLFVLFNFRVESAIITIFMIIILHLKSSFRMILFALIIFFIIGLIIFREHFDNLFRLVDYYSQFNAERMGAIGGKIFSLPILIGLIPRIIYLIFTPVPNFTSFHQLYTSISAILQIISFPFLFWGILKNKIDSHLLITFLMFFIGVAISTATFRHVMMYLPFGIIATIISYNTNTVRFLSNRYLLTIYCLFIVFSCSIFIALIY